MKMNTYNNINFAAQTLAGNQNGKYSAGAYMNAMSSTLLTSDLRVEVSKISKKVRALLKA